MTENSRAPKHLKARKHRENPFGIRAALASSAAILSGILFAVAGTAGSYALWNSTAPITAASITSGSLDLTIAQGGGASGSTAAIPETAWSSLLPGDFVGQQVTVTNTGNITANLSARLAATTPYEIRVATGTCPGTQLTFSPLTTTDVSFGTLTGGTATNVCVQVTLPTTAAPTVQGTSSPFTVVITGAQ